MIHVDMYRLIYFSRRYIYFFWPTYIRRSLKLLYFSIIFIVRYIILTLFGYIIVRTKFSNIIIYYSVNLYLIIRQLFRYT